MPTLIFNGPVKFTLFKNKDDAKRIGIYIWGFFLDKIFIPYYTGETLSCFLVRIQREISEIKSSKSTWTRLSKDYFVHFGADTRYKMRQRRSRKDYNKHERLDYFDLFINGEIAYANNKAFVERVIDTKIDKRNNYDISLLKNHLENDFLRENIDEMYLCYAIVDDKVVTKALLEKLESLTKFSLRGKTEGAFSYNAEALQTAMIDCEILYEPGETNDIFKRGSVGNIIFNDIFEGFL